MYQWVLPRLWRYIFMRLFKRCRKTGRWHIHWIPKANLFLWELCLLRDNVILCGSCCHNWKQSHPTKGAQVPWFCEAISPFPVPIAATSTLLLLLLLPSEEQRSPRSISLILRKIRLSPKYGTCGQTMDFSIIISWRFHDEWLMDGQVWVWADTRRSSLLISSTGLILAKK